MIYARLLLIATIVLVTLSTTTVMILSQSSTRQVGTPICEIYPNSGQPGRNCASIRCSKAGYSGLPPRGDPQICTPTHPDDQSENHCESNGGVGEGVRSCFKTHKGCNRRSIKRIIAI